MFVEMSPTPTKAWCGSYPLHLHLQCILYTGVTCNGRSENSKQSIVGASLSQQFFLDECEIPVETSSLSHIYYQKLLGGREKLRANPSPLASENSNTARASHSDPQARFGNNSARERAERDFIRKASYDRCVRHHTGTPPGLPFDIQSSRRSPRYARDEEIDDATNCVLPVSRPAGQLGHLGVRNDLRESHRAPHMARERICIDGCVFLQGLR